MSTSNAMTRVKNRRSDAETTVYLLVGMPTNARVVLWGTLRGTLELGVL